VSQYKIFVLNKVPALALITKGDILADKFKKQNTDDINKLAQSMGLQLQNAEDIAFSSFTIPGIGMEFKVIAAATTLPVNKTSVPIVGNQGVFVIKVNKGEEKGVNTLESVKTKWTRDFVYRVDYQAYEAMKKAANIVDERYKFE
jgi:peptidyl-prolyl cis-trans isomerase D